MKLNVGQLSLLRGQGLLAARAAMSRPRQAGFGMAAALILAGQLSGYQSSELLKRHATLIQPSAVDYVRAVDEGLFFPDAPSRRDAAVSLARREAPTLLAGFSGTITVAAADAPEAALNEVAVVDTGLPNTITQAQERIERPALRSKTGESLNESPTLLALVSEPAPSAAAEGENQALAEDDGDDRASEIKSVMIRLSQEAHQRAGRPALSSQAMSDYLSLYAMRQRVAEIGRAFVDDQPNAEGGTWVANLGAGTDDALFQNGFAPGDTSFASLAGVDGAVRNVFSNGDQLVFGGFAGAFGQSADNRVSPLPSTMRGGSMGLFAVLDDGPFSVSALLRADLAETLDGLAPNRLDFSSAMQVLKAEVVARYRFDVSDWTVEPSAGLTYTTGRREVFGLTSLTPAVEQAESLKFQLGVKASGVVYNRSGTSVEPSVTITIAEELRDSGNVTFLSGAPNAAAEPIRGKTVGSVSIGVDVKDESGWTGFVRADGQISDDDKPSAGVSAGVKTQW